MTKTQSYIVNHLKSTLVFLFVFVCASLLAHCGSSGTSEESLDTIGALPSFSPSGSESLDSYVINTFQDNGIEIGIDPEKMDFNLTYGNLSLGDIKQIPFVLTNNSSEDHTFTFNTYAVSSGFALLDSYKNNIGSWNQITIAAGASETFHIQFKANSYGTQMSYLVITADISGNIYLPFRAKVTGGGSALRVIPTAYTCSDEDAPEILSMDFYKVPTGDARVQSLKVCNIGGDDLKIYSTKITTKNTDDDSAYFEQSDFSGFDINTFAEIDDAFSLDIEPDFTETFIEPETIASSTTITNPETYYDVVEYTSQTNMDNIIVEASDYTRFDVSFAPNLKIEAGPNQRYEALPANALLTLETSLGPVEIDLLGATAGYEPSLTLQYRFDESEEWTDVDMTSNVAAIDFGTLNVFLDSIPNNDKIVELQVGNAGTASYPLEFFPTDLVGYFEYYVNDGETLQFPLQVQNGEFASFKIRYLPTPENKTAETHWDVGQLRFQHNGGNGPNGQVSFVADQSYGYATEVALNGTKLKHEYSENESKSLCAVQIDGHGRSATRKTFVINNHDPINTLQVTWRFNATEGDLNATSENPRSFTVAPDSTQDLVIDFSAGSTEDEGNTLKGTLSIENTFVTPEGQNIENLYGDILATREDNDFAIHLSAEASSTGECDLAPNIFADDDGDGIIPVTMIRDRTYMIMPDLTESNRDLPSNISNLPLEINLNTMTVRIKEIPIPTDFSQVPDKRNIFRAYSHFFTNSKGCPTLPTVPYGSDYGPIGFLEPNGLACGDVVSNDGEFSVNMGQLNLEDTGPFEYTDSNNTLWRVYPHRFGKVNIDTCQVEYYGQVTNLALKPNEETLEELFERVHETPYESEAFYENAFGAWKHNSFIKIEADNFQCGSKTYRAGDTITDPDELKECYLYLSTLDSSLRLNGRFDQASYFYFEVKEGDTTCDFDNPDTCHGIGPITKHVTPEGEVLDNYYDLTMYNAELNVYVLTAGDRNSLLRHETHNIYTKLFITFTTQVLASELDANGDYKQLVADKTRKHIDKNQIFIKDGELYDIGKFWTEEGLISEASTIPNPETLPESGVDYGGYGKGMFRKCENPAICDIIPGGWPLNLESTHIAFNGVAAFDKTGNLVPIFTKASGNKGKPLFFYMEGCLAPGHDIDPTRGCYSYKLDNAVMPNSTAPILDEYSERNMLPSGYPEDASACSTAIDAPENDPTSPDFDPYKYMSCINYQIKDIDRDRLTNYYDKSNPFVYETNFYGASYCGYGM